MYETDISTIGQLDGNITNISTSSKPPQPTPPTKSPPPPQYTPLYLVSNKSDKITAAISLPTVATYKMRSLLPKIGNLTTDILERQIDVSFLCKIWEQEHNKHHQFELEKLLRAKWAKIYVKLQKTYLQRCILWWCCDSG